MVPVTNLPILLWPKLVEGSQLFFWWDDPHDSLRESGDGYGVGRYTLRLRRANWVDYFLDDGDGVGFDCQESRGHTGYGMGRGGWLAGDGTGRGVGDDNHSQ